MHDRQTTALAAVLSSILLVALIFVYAIWRDADWGAAFALLTAFAVYTFQQAQYAETLRLALLERYELPGYLGILHVSALASGTTSFLLAAYGV